MQLFHRDTTSESENQISKDMEDKIIKLMEIFPQKSKKDLLEVISPLLMQYQLIKQVNTGFYPVVSLDIVTGS